jgi:hypothetical protein
MLHHGRGVRVRGMTEDAGVDWCPVGIVVIWRD